MLNYLLKKNREKNELDVCQQTDNTSVDMVYMANHFIFSEFAHPGYVLKSIESIADNQYKITISDGYNFVINKENADEIIIAIADEFNHYYREHVCNLPENLYNVRN